VGQRVLLSAFNPRLPVVRALFKDYSMREIQPEDTIRKPIYWAYIVFFVVLVLLLALAANELGLIGGPSEITPEAVRPILSNPAPVPVAPVPVSPVPAAPLPAVAPAVRLSAAPEPSDTLPANIAELAALAAGGNAFACIELGDRYRLGTGCIRDLEESRRWYEKAATHSDSGSEMKLAAAFDRLGYHHRAAGLYEKAALRGVAEAQVKIGLYNVRPGTVDVVEAYAWFNVSASSGDSQSASMRDKLEESYSSDVIAMGQKRSRELLKESGSR
jgi:hypothetical protein